MLNNTDSLFNQIDHFFILQCDHNYFFMCEDKYEMKPRSSFRKYCNTVIQFSSLIVNHNHIYHIDGGNRRVPQFQMEESLTTDDT